MGEKSKPRGESRLFMEILRIILGSLRPELRKAAQNIANFLPEGLRKEWVGRIIGGFAQWIEKQPLGGFQESISDFVEIISDEISKITKKQKEEIQEELKIKIEKVRQLLNQGLENIIKVENIQEEKEKQLQRIEAFKEIFMAMKELEELVSPPKEVEEKKIDWEKVFEELRNWKEVVLRSGEKFLEKVKEIDKKLDEEANKIEEFRKQRKRWWRLR